MPGGGLPIRPARAGHVRAASRPVEAGGAARPGSMADLSGTVAAAVTAAANLPGRLLRIVDPGAV